MKIKIIAEIGLNHLGEESYLDQYLSILKKKKIHGVSFQIPKKIRLQ